MTGGTNWKLRFVSGFAWATLAATASAATDVSVTATATPDPITTGSLLTYEARVSNAGTSTATNVVFQQTIPSGTTFVSAESSSGSVQVLSGSIRCDIKDLPPTPATESDWSVLANSPVPLTALAADAQTQALYALGNESSSFYKYSPSANTWTPLNAAPFSSSNNAGAVILGRTYYALYTSISGGNRYNLDTNTWSAFAGPGFSTGTVGTDGTYMYAVADTTFARYLPSGGSWETLPAPPFSFNKWGVLAYYDGWLYGTRGDGTTNFARYNVSSGVWEQLPSVPGGAVLGGAIDPIAGIFYAYGSYDSNNLYKFDLKLGTWTSMIIPVFTGISDGGMAYLAGPLRRVYMLQGQSRYGFAALETSTQVKITMRVRPQLPGTISSTAQASLAESDTNFANNTQTVQTTVRAAAADLLVHETGPSNPLLVGETARFTTTLYNLGPDVAYNPKVKIDLPNTVEYVDASVTTGSVIKIGNSLQWNLPDLPATPVSETDWRAMPSAPTGLSGLAADPVDNRLYAQAYGSYAAYRFNAETQQWSGIAPSPVYNSSRAGGGVIGRKYYVLYSGTSSSGAVYDIVNNSWATFPSPGFATSVVGTDGSYLYAASGYTFSRYNPVTNTWQPLASPPLYLYQGGMAFLEGDVYVAKGSGYGEFLKYNIATNSWTPLANSPTGNIQGMAINPVARKLYAFGYSYYYYSAYLNTYDLDAGSWTTSLIPLFSYTYDGGSMAYLESPTPYVYALQSYSSTSFAAIRGDTIPSLKLQVKPKQVGQFTIEAKASTTSGDPDLSNNSDAFTARVPVTDLTVQWNYAWQDCGADESKPCKLRGSATIQNEGGLQAKKFSTRIYLSDDNMLSADDVLVLSKRAKALKPKRGQFVKFTRALGLASAHGKYLLAIVDYDNVIDETDENNNLAAFGPLP